MRNYRWLWVWIEYFEYSIKGIIFEKNIFICLIFLEIKGLEIKIVLRIILFLLNGKE